MPVPEFQDLMLPLLRHLANGEEHRTSECVTSLADALQLSSDDRSELLPSGKQTRFANRINWSTTHLYKAGLIERPARGRVRITARGQDALGQNSSRIDMKFLSRYPEYLHFQPLRQPWRKEGFQDAGPDIPEQTPEELLETSFQSLQGVLADDLLDRIGRYSPGFFERLVVDLLVAMGYGGSRIDAGQAVGKSGDEGIDGIIKEDRLGLDFIYVQAKRWNGPVRRPDVQAFAGSLEGQRARKGVFITTSRFTQDAHEYVTKIEKRIVLIDGEQLARLLIDHGVGVVDVATYRVKRIDADYFEE